MSDSEQQRIELYVRLLNEGTKVARQTTAICLPDGLFKLLPSPGYDPDDEQWEFPPNSIVAAQLQEWSSNKILVAVLVETTKS